MGKLFAMSATTPTVALSNRAEPRPFIAPRHTLRDILTVVFRERRILLWTFSLIALGGALIALKLQTVYTAEARVLVLPSQEYMLRPDVGELSMNMGLGDDRIVRSETEIFKNPQLIERVIEDIGLSHLYPALSDPESDAEDIAGDNAAPAGQPPSGFMARLAEWWHTLFSSGTPQANMDPQQARRNARLNQAVIRFASQLEVLPVKDASVIELRFSNANAAIAAEALNQMILVYLEHRRSIFALSRVPLFIEQRNNFAQRLNSLEKDIEAFKMRHDISTFNDQKSLLLRQQSTLQNDQMDTSTRLREIEGRISTIREQMARTPRTIDLFADNTEQDARDTARATLVTLEARRNELLTKFSDTSKFITDLDDQIVKLRAILGNTPPKKSDSRRSGRNPLYDELDTDLTRRQSEAAALRARQQSLTGQIEEISARLAEFDRLERDFNALTLQRTLLEKNLQVYAQKAEEALIQEELDRQKSANVRVIENAQIPRQGSSLRKAVVVLALLGGLVIALVLAFLKDFFREVLISPEDAERSLELPVLVAVPLRESNGRRS